MIPGLGKPWRSKTVPHSSEIRRIIALPRRVWTDAETAKLAEDLTKVLRTPNGTMTLRPVQALALHDLAVTRGLFASLRVSGGKTLISFLAPYVLDAHRPVLLIPASLREKTDRAQSVLSEHWRIPRTQRIVHYEELGREKGASLLALYRPDLIGGDEAHRLKNRSAGVTRRVERYMHEYPATLFYAMSGTFLTHGIGDFAHIVAWALKAGSPLPLNNDEISLWGHALDEKVNALTRVEPGALLDLLADRVRGEGEDTETARGVFRVRLLETPGVVATPGEQVSCSLYVRRLEYPVNAATEANFLRLRTEWALPCGWELTEAIDVWRHAQELALGFHYIWDPRPQDEWLICRSAWAKFARGVITRSHHLDTEKTVREAVLRGELPRGELDAWQRIAPSFVINQKAVWHDTGALDACISWGKEGAGIVWCDHTFFALELSKRTGWPYFGAKGRDARGRRIDNPAEVPQGRGVVIASVDANKTGRDLQTWSRNLVTSSQGAADWEQMLGRTHRDGQLADEVEVDVLFSCIEHFDGWNKAIAMARMTETSSGANQKLLIADHDMPESLGASHMGYRWRKT